jgi:hypothetical protein
MYGKNFLLLLMIATAIALYSCQKDDDLKEQGTMRVEMTDAPIDDANVKAVFVTVADLKVDGASVEGFSKATIEVSALQNGLTELLCDTQLDAGAYSQVTLVLDYAADEAGAAPGCYVVDAAGMKHQLLSQAGEIVINHDFTIESGQQTDLVLDFDLRKCLIKEEGGADGYDFVTKAELEQSLRVVPKASCGIVKGTCSDLLTDSDKIVVYAYAKGTFNKGQEIQGQGASQIQFANAVTSAAVGADGKFELHFLEAGEYELHFCSYEENANGEMELQGFLSLNVLNSINLGGITVGASASVTVEVLVTGLLP